MAFDLNSISRTRRIRAPKVAIAGPGKVGKTTFAASAPKSIGILTEDGADAVDAMAFPMCASLDDVYAAIGTLLNQPHDYQTVWLDSLDWCEPLVNDYVCRKNSWASIEAPGYGKGHVAAEMEWRNLLAGFEALRAQRNMGVILIAHDKIKKFDSPLDDGYDQYALKLHDRAAALVKEWVDVLGWASHEILTRQVDAGFNKKESKASTTGRRMLHVTPHPAHMGGNRFGMQDIPLSWADFAAEFARVNTVVMTPGAHPSEAQQPLSQPATA